MLSERFRGFDISAMFNNLRRSGKEYGIEFADRTLLSNSRLSLEAGEYARDMGKYDAFHDKVFHAYFTDALDIGDIDVLSNIATGCGLDAVDMQRALAEGKYRHRLEAGRLDAQEISLTAVPTFVVDNNRHKIVGAQPLTTFSDILNKLLEIE